MVPTHISFREKSLSTLKVMYAPSLTQDHHDAQLKGYDFQLCSFFHVNSAPLELCGTSIYDGLTKWTQLEIHLIPLFAPEETFGSGVYEAKRDNLYYEKVL